jgi:hypothetical protein
MIADETGGIQSGRSDRVVVSWTPEQEGTKARTGRHSPPVDITGAGTEVNDAAGHCAVTDPGLSRSAMTAL